LIQADKFATFAANFGLAAKTDEADWLFTESSQNSARAIIPIETAYCEGRLRRFGAVNS
jgi:hypothetical protein